MDSLKHVLKRYLSPAGPDTELQKAKQDLRTIQDFLDKNLETVKKNKVPIPYSGVAATRYLDEALRVEDANFDLIVKIEEKDVKVQGSGSGLVQLSGFSMEMQTYAGVFMKFHQRFRADVQRCLKELIKEKGEFAGRISIVSRSHHRFQVIVDKFNDDNTGSSKVPIVSVKKGDYEPPWFAINLKVVVTNGQNDFLMMMPQQGSQAPVWIEYREDPVDPDSKSTQTILRAILYCEPFLCHHSTFDIIASSVAAYVVRCRRRGSQRPVNSGFGAKSGAGSGADWSNLEESVLNVLDEMHKALKTRRLPYHGCAEADLFGHTGKKACNKLGRFLHELMLNHCEAVRKIISRHVEVKSAEE